MNIPKVPIGEILYINDRIYLGTTNGNINITQKKDYFFVVETKNEIINLTPEDRNTKNLYFSLNDCFVYSFVGGIEDVNIIPIVMNVNCFSEDTQSAKFWYNTTEGSLKYRNTLNEIIDLNAIALSIHNHTNLSDLEKVSGSNTGDETRNSIINKIGFEVSPEGHTHADILGNAATADKLKNPIAINGIAFDGSEDITIKPSNIIWNYLFRTITDNERDYWNNKQGKDTNLSAILALEEPSGILRKNGLGSWSLDNSEYSLDNSVVKLTGDQVVNGIKTFNNDIYINGNIYQQGAAYETHAEKVYTKNDFITLREGAVSGLNTGYTGLIAKLYDGVNDGQLVFDANGIARIGDVGFTQAIATREDNPVNNKVAVWNSANMRFETANAPTTIAEFGITDAITTIGGQTINGALTLTGLITANTTKALCGNYTTDIIIGTSASSVIGYKMNMYSDSGQSMLKFTTKTTGQTATDGLDVGISSGGDAEFRYRENGHICFYTGNTLHTALYKDSGLLTSKKITSYTGVVTPLVQIGGNAINGYSLNAYTSTAAASMFKFSNLTTGQTATDGLDFGITSDGTAEIRQRENLPLNLYTNNILAMNVSATQNFGFKTTSPKSLIQLGNKANIFNGANVANANWLDLGYNIYYNGGYKYTTGTGIAGDEACLVEIGAGGVGFYTAVAGVADEAVSLTKIFQVTKNSVQANKYQLNDLNTAPTSLTDTGDKGEIRITADYIYVCIATNTWKRIALSNV